MYCVVYIEFNLVSINSNMFRNCIYDSQYVVIGFFTVLGVIIAKGNMLTMLLVCL